MNTEKMSRIAIPEQQYLHLKKMMKEVGGTYKTVGEYILHQLDELAIISCENDRLASQNEKMKNENAALLKERQQAVTQIAASEARVLNLQKNLQEKENIESELRSLKDKYNTLQQANETKDIELRKLKGEKILAEKKASLLTSENFNLFRTLVEMRTFRGRLKNLFS